MAVELTTVASAEMMHLRGRVLTAEIALLPQLGTRDAEELTRMWPECDRVAGPRNRSQAFRPSPTIAGLTKDRQSAEAKARPLEGGVGLAQACFLLETMPLQLRLNPCPGLQRS